MSILSTLPHKTRKRRTAEQVEQLSDQMVDALSMDHPQSVRHVFYLMTNPTLLEPVDKTEAGYRQVQNYMTKLRREGRIPYGWVTDATRRGYHVNTYGNAGDFISSMAGLYRGDLWRDAEHYVEVWCESRSIAGVIDDTCDELAVSLYPSGGFSSISLVYQAAEYINRHTDFGEKPAEVIYIGDYDPAGVLIDKSIENELREHLFGVELTFHRIAINEDQIIDHDLPTKPRKLGDRRVLDLVETVEAEAMPVRILRDLLREKVESYLPNGALEVVQVVEGSERAGLVRLGMALENRSTTQDLMEMLEEAGI